MSHWQYNGLVDRNVASQLVSSAELGADFLFIFYYLHAETDWGDMTSGTEEHKDMKTLRIDKTQQLQPIEHKTW